MYRGFIPPRGINPFVLSCSSYDRTTFSPDKVGANIILALTLAQGLCRNSGSSHSVLESSTDPASMLSNNQLRASGACGVGTRSCSGG